MATVLIVEDDKSTRTLTAARLKPYYDVVCAEDGFAALDAVYAGRIDCIVSDVMMPNMDGYELLKRLRAEHIDIPVLLLTAKTGFEDMRQGYTLGTDEYLTKPVRYEELLWKIAALLRRSKIAAERKITIGTTVADAATYSVTRNGEKTELPKKEFELLFKLLSYPSQIMTKDQLLDEIWGTESDSGEDTIKVHINRLRNKFEGNTDFEIVTVRGLGYKAEVKN